MRKTDRYIKSGRSEQILEIWLERNLSIIVFSDNNCFRFLKRKIG